MIYAVFKDKE